MVDLGNFGVKLEVCQECACPFSVCVLRAIVPFSVSIYTMVGNLVYLLKAETGSTAIQCKLNSKHIMRAHFRWQYNA